jgi:hypothetical protein
MTPQSEEPPNNQKNTAHSTVTCMSVTIDGFWIDDQISLFLTAVHACTHISTCVHSHISTTVACSNCPPPQLPYSHIN